jgi:hypothetical protein
MAKSSETRINMTELKRKLIASAQRAPLLPAQAEMAQRAQMRAKKRAAGKKLASLLGKNADLAKVNAILAQSHREQSAIATKRTPELIKANAALDSRMRQGLANRKRALETLALPGLPFAPTLIPLKPFLIWAKPSNSLYDSSISPGASLAKLYFYTDDDSAADNTLTFYFLWINPSAYYAVINASCTVSFMGSAQAEANTGIFDGGLTSFYGAASLNLVEWWLPQTPYPAVLGTRKNFMSLVADGGGFWSLETGDVDMKTSFDNVDLRYELFSIPPGATVVAEVVVDLQYSIDDGEILYDFAKFPNYGIVCTSLQLELLTAPTGLNVTGMVAAA